MFAIRNLLRVSLILPLLFTAAAGGATSLKASYSNGAPAAGASVILQGKDCQTVFTCDANGRVTISQAPEEGSMLLLKPAAGEQYVGLVLPAAVLAGGETALVLQSKPAAVVREGAVRARASVSQASAYTLSGTIYGGSSVLPGAVITLFDASTASQISSTTTDAEGHYSFPVDNGTFNLLVSPPAELGFTDSVVNGIVVNGAPVTQNVVLLKQAVTLSGVVRGPDGTPVSNIVINVSDQNTGSQVGWQYTDAAGAYSIGLAGGTYYLNAYGNTNDSNHVPSIPIPTSFSINYSSLVVTTPTVKDIELPVVTLQGRVTDSDGTAVAGVRLQLSSSYYDSVNSRNLYCDIGSSVMTDADGHYETLMLAGSYPFMLFPPTGMGLPQTTFPGVEATSDTVHDFVLPREIMLSGVVRGPDGTPVSNIIINLYDQSNGTQVGWQYTDAAGAYSIGLAGGTYSIYASGNTNDSNHLPNIPTPTSFTVYYPNLVVTTPTVQDIELPVVTLQGRVTDSDGLAVAGVRLQLNNGYNDSVNNRYLYCDIGSNVITDADGHYETLILAGSYSFTLYPPAGLGLPQTTFPGVEATSDTVHDFVLPREIMLSGVVRGPDGTPVSNIVVYVYDQSNWSQVGWQYTDAAGAYSIGLAGGTYAVYASGNTYDSSHVPNIPIPYNFNINYSNLVVTTNTVQDIELPIVTLQGNTTDSNGVAVPGVRLALNSGYYDSVNIRNLSCDIGSAILSDVVGHYATPLLGGRYPITIYPPEGSGFATTTITNMDARQSLLQNIILNIVDTHAPVIIAGPYVSMITDSTALVEWQTTEPASSGVRYGASDPLGSLESVTGLRTSHSVPISGLTPDTLYHVQATCLDAAGNGPTISEMLSFRTQPEPDLKPPTIVEGPIVTSISHNSAVVEWTTNEPATSVVRYGLSEAVDRVTPSNEHAIHHMVTLPELAPHTLYFLKMASTDIAGNGPVESPLISFTTLVTPDLNPPRIVEGPMAINLADTEATIIWTTDEPATSGVSYNNGTAYGVVQDVAMTLNHSVRLTDLNPNTTYNYTVSSKDEAGNGPTLSDTLTFLTLAAPDHDPPVIIEGPIIVNVTHQSAVVRWITDEPADSVIEYGLTADLGTTATRTALVRHHNFALVGLTSDTLYYFRVRSSDASNNPPVLSEIDSFRTDAIPDKTKPEFLDGPRIIGKTDTTATIYWLTDESADTVADYGEGLDLNLRRSDGAKVTEHQITLTNLTPNQAYSIAASSTDLEGNRASSIDSVESAMRSGLRRASSVPLSFTTNLNPDTTPPVFTEAASVIAVSGRMALIRWVTDEIADTRLFYGLQGQTRMMFAGDLNRCLEHLVVLTNLDPSTTYEFQAASRDVSGNQSAGGVLSFTTQGQSDRMAPTLSGGPSTQDGGAGRHMTIDWDTDEYATSQVLYGTDASNLNERASLNGLSLDHTVTLTGIDPGARYYYRIISVDAAGNRFTSGTMSFGAENVSAARDWQFYD